MAALTEAGLLHAWEAGRGHGPVHRALALATAAGADPSSIADLSVGRREEFLLTVRESCFGTTFPCAVTCPSCQEELEIELTAADVRAGPAPEETGRLVADGFEVEFRPITSRDLLAVGESSELLSRCVLAARKGGREVPVDRLPHTVFDALDAALSTQDPQASVLLALDCALCGEEWRSPFDTAAYLWAELDVYARRLLRDVHALASVYGWSESDVLAVSPVRRRCYLEMAGL